MAIDSDSHDQSDGDRGRLLSPLFASTKYFSGNLLSGRHHFAVTPALAVANAALARHLRLCAGVRKGRHSEHGCVTVLGWLCMCVCGNLAGPLGQCLAECALNCRYRQKQGTSRYEQGYAQDTVVRADQYWYTFRYGLRYVQIQTGVRADTSWYTCR